MSMAAPIGLPVAMIRARRRKKGCFRQPSGVFSQLLVLQKEASNVEFHKAYG